MEELISSSSVKSVVSCSSDEAIGPAQSAESSWTEYFVDFMMSEEEKKKREDDSYRNDGGDDDDNNQDEEEDSMISDAASHAPVAFTNKYNELRKLKKKVFGPLDADSLEDTASSPVNSPKVSALSQLELSPTRRRNLRDLKKEGEAGGHDQRERMDTADHLMEEGSVGFVERGSACAELKGKGLCLFPLSMFLHYHG